MMPRWNRAKMKLPLFGSRAGLAVGRPQISRFSSVSRPSLPPPSGKASASGTAAASGEGLGQRHGAGERLGELDRLAVKGVRGVRVQERLHVGDVGGGAGL